MRDDVGFVFQMTIDNSVYKEISCVERHQLIPFSNHTSGAVTSTRSKFVFRGEESYSVNEFFNQSKYKALNMFLKKYISISKYH